MHTPEQARELWCPQVRGARHEVTQVETARTVGDVPLIAIRTDHHITGGCNTDALGGNRVPASCRCVADQCAMWRWHPTTLLHPNTGELTMSGAGGVTDRIPAKGFCGIAGLPGAAA